MIEGITFDFWSTLFRDVDPRRTSRVRFDNIQDFLQKNDIKIEPTELELGLKEAWKQTYYQQRARGKDIGPRGQVELLGQILNLPPDPGLREGLYRTYTDVLRQIPPVMVDHAPEALEYLSRRYLVALICNTGATPGAILRQIMDDNGILRYFNTTVFSDEVSFAKPNPEIFGFALGLMRVSPERAVHIGDDPLTDIIGAKRAGMKAVWFSAAAEWTVPECDWHIKSLEELLQIL
jgi:putative hydrolase of the HAD superfamily